MFIRNARVRVVLVLAVAVATLAPVSPASASYLRLPARTWGTNGRILTILPVGDRVYVGGTFTDLIDPSGVSYPVSNLAVFSAVTGAADLSFQAATDGSVNALASDGTSLYIGGTFGTVSHGPTTETRSRVAALDPSTGVVQSWAPDVAGQVDAVTFSPATASVYIGGNISEVSGTGGSSTPHPFIAKIDAASGAVDSAFAAAPNDRVRALNVAGDGSGRLYIGGNFTSVSGAPKTRSFTAVDLTTGVVDPSFAPAPYNQGASPVVTDITSDATRVFVAAGGSGGACAGLTASTGALLWSNHANGNMQSIRLVSDSLYCGGHFGGSASFAGVAREKLAAVDPATGSVRAFDPRINSSLGTWSLGAQPGDPNLYLGGDFTEVSGVPQPHYAEFIDSSLRRAPQPPGDLSAQPGDNAALLSWAVPSSDGGKSILSYQIYQGLSPGGESAAPLATVPASTTTYNDTTAVNGTTYYYVVKATNNLGSSVASNEATVTPDAGAIPDPPGPPTSIAATNPPGTVHITWNPPVHNGGAPVTTYNVYRGTTAGDEDVVPYATGIAAVSFDDVFNVVAGTKYFYKVTAVNASGEGPPSAEVSATLLPGKPGRPTLEGTRSGGVVSLSWTTPPDGGSPIQKYVLLRDAVKLVGRIIPSQTTYSDSTVQPGRTYIYQIKAVNGQGSGPLSNKVTLTDQ